VRPCHLHKLHRANRPASAKAGDMGTGATLPQAVRSSLPAASSKPRLQINEPGTFHRCGETDGSAPGAVTLCHACATNPW
jgi:hypothetical protein